MKKCIMIIVFYLLFALPVWAVPIEDVHFANTPTGGIVRFTTDTAYKGLVREFIILDALSEWDAIVCTERYFILDYLIGTIRITWEDLGDSDTLALGGNNEIIINSNSGIKWYEGFGKPSAGQFDLLSVLKHEIGHAIGVVGDWGRLDSDGVGEEYNDKNNDGHIDKGEYYDTNLNGKYDPDYTPPEYAHSDQLMWGFFAPEQVIREVRYCDAKELEKAYTVHAVPEPSTMLLVGAGFVALGFMRKRVRY